MNSYQMNLSFGNVKNSFSFKVSSAEEDPLEIISSRKGNGIYSAADEDNLNGKCSLQVKVFISIRQQGNINGC